MSVLNTNRSLNSTLQAYFDEHATCPSLDTWLSEKLSHEHRLLYQTLMQFRNVCDGKRFTVDFDALWPLLGYTTKGNAKVKLTKRAEEYRDYEVILRPQNNPQGGRGTEAILLTFDAAQRFAIQAGTARSNEIADFFIKTIETVQDYHLLSIHYDKRQAVMDATEGTMLSFLEKGKKIVYMGDLGIINDEHLIKLGYTNDGPTRIQTLKRGFPNGFRLVHIEEHPENQELEARFKRHADVCTRQRDVWHLGKKYTECFAVDESMTGERYVKLVHNLGRGLADHAQVGWSHEERMKELECEQERLKIAHESEQTKARLVEQAWASGRSSEEIISILQMISGGPAAVRPPTPPVATTHHSDMNQPADCPNNQSQNTDSITTWVAAHVVSNAGDGAISRTHIWEAYRRGGNKRSQTELYKALEAVCGPFHAVTVPHQGTQKRARGWTGFAYIE